jgi:hypothetical protein
MVSCLWFGLNKNCKAIGVATLFYPTYGILQMKLKPTPEQQLIINHLHGHGIVKAGPGCAKTSTLALRVKYLRVITAKVEDALGKGERLWN